MAIENRPVIAVVNGFALVAKRNRHVYDLGIARYS